MRLRNLAVAVALVLAACQQGRESEEIDILKSHREFLPLETLIDLGSSPDVGETRSGVRYIVLEEGDQSQASARRAEEVFIEFTAFSRAEDYITGQSYYGAENVITNELVPGWRDALALMKPGDEWILFIPAELGFDAPNLSENVAYNYLVEPTSGDLLVRLKLDSFVSTGPSEIDMLNTFENFLTPDVLAALGPDPEILETDSGLRYIVVNSADPAGVSPEVYDEVKVHYDGRLAEDGTKFDSSYDRGSPATFPAGRLIPGWVEALGLMKPGDEWVLLIPSDLGYGAAGTPGGPIPPDADLVFRVELQDVIPGTPPPPPRETDADAWARLNPWPANDPDVVKTESGLQYVVLASGDPEGVPPRSFDNVVVYYEGRLADGTVFDSAFERGSPAVFPAGGLIPGWVEALALMRPGDRWMLNVPYQLAYGEEGIDPDIPPAADLTFEVELMDVLRND